MYVGIAASVSELGNQESPNEEIVGMSDLPTAMGCSASPDVG
jgi:hypothetical protein